MDTLRLIVRSILVIIFMAAFLEIMLPRSDMKRYINLIIGLFVIISILNPLLSLIDKGVDMDVFEQTAQVPGSDTETLIQKGLTMGQRQKTEAVSQYKEKLSKQIAALARLYPDAQITGVEVEVVEDASEPTFGQLKEIILYTGSVSKNGAETKDTGASQVDEVQVEQIQIKPDGTGPGRESIENNSAMESELKEVIANFYGLALNQVAVQN